MRIRDGPARGGKVPHTRAGLQPYPGTGCRLDRHEVACALGMATPLALIRGGGMAAERAILMRSGEAFQILKDITHVVFDKTGTVTAGKPQVVAIEPMAGFDRGELFRLAAAAEASSEHPLGRALAEAAGEAGIALPEAGDVAAVAGKEVSARSAPETPPGEIAVGTPWLLAVRSGPC